MINMTPENAIRLAETTLKGEFTVPEIYGTAWNLVNPNAALFGRQFGRLIEQGYSDRIIQLDQKKENRKVYRII